MVRFALSLALALCLFPSDAYAQEAVCENGLARSERTDESFACRGMDLLANVTLGDLGASTGNDLWGWTDPQTGDEYALIAVFEGTAFVRVSDPENPVYLGTLPTHTLSDRGQIWRDLKVYADHAYIVSEASGHGMQVFDLRQLRTVASSPVTFSETAHYDAVTNAHNIAINEATGFGYILGAGNDSEEACGRGLHIVNLAAPASPSFAGCFGGAGYLHDAQCIVYDGPDADYTGREICFAMNGFSTLSSFDRLLVIDVTDKGDTQLAAEAIYPNPSYAHQGWLTEDRRFFIAGDEGDEQRYDFNTRTLVFDVSDLDEPAFLESYTHTTAAIDHNLYIKGSDVYEANYQAGLRILDASALLQGGDGPGLEEVAFFDTYPEGDRVGYGGAWSTYPFFESGTLLVSDENRGLFVLRRQDGASTRTGASVPAAFELSAVHPNPFSRETRFTLRVGVSQAVTVEVYDVLGRRQATLFDGVLAAGEERTLALEGNGLHAGTYFLRVTGEDFAETRQVVLAR